MSRAIVQDQTFLGHQSIYPAIMRHPEHSAGGDRRPSRLLQMRKDYQQRLMKEKEERMLNMYEVRHKKNLERAERLVKAPAPHEDYPNSKLRQPGYMQQQQQQLLQPQSHQHPPLGQMLSNPSIRNFFRERREMEAKGSYVPPINQHFKDRRRRGGSSHSYHKNSAGVDRANPLAPIQPRHGGISSAPTQHPLRNKPRLVKQNTSSPDFSVNGHIKPNQRASPKKPSPPARGHPSAGRDISSKAEKLSDFQKWQLEQNKTREERLKKLNMRAPPSDRESKNWEGDYEYEEEEEEVESEGEDNGQAEELKRKELELLQRIAQQQADLDRLRREREEEEELERQEAVKLRQQQAADRERRRRQQQEEARQRREEEAQARREEEAQARRREEEQQRAARARIERQRFEAHLDLYGDSAQNDSYPTSQPNSNRDDPFRPNSHRDNNPFQPNSHRSNDNNHLRRDSTNSVQATPKFTPKPPSEGCPPRKHTYPRSHPPPQRKPAPPVEEHDDVAVPGPGVELYAQAVDEEQGMKMRLMSCKICGRRFAEDRIQKHQAACKNAHKKRAVMDPTKTRTDGTDMASYIRQGAHKKKPPQKKKADWRRQHQEFISNIRYAKQMQQMEKQGVALKDLSPPPPSQVNQDLVPCPHCRRTFNEQAAERHIPRCQEMKTRPVGVNRRRR